jgi:heat-inducible transcriptional repressor
MLEPRKNELFKAIVEEHIREGIPVGSKALASINCINRSPATIRNEMNELEQDGYITQPHVSAGRIPTAKGWEYYIQNLLKEIAPSKKHEDMIKQALVDAHPDNSALKQVAKTLAELSQNAAIVAFSSDDVYYTGLSNMFHEPEFASLSFVQHMTEVIDHLDDVMHTLFTELKPGLYVLTGEHNPFDKSCGVIVNKFEHKGEERILGILGPMRMAYGENKGLLNFTTHLLTA